MSNSNKFSMEEIQFMNTVKDKFSIKYADIIDSILNKMQHINNKIDKNVEATRERVALKRQENKHYGR